MEHSAGSMEIDIKASLKQIIFKALVDILGLTEGNIKDSGKIIKCMEKVFLFGQITENIKVNT